MASPRRAKKNKPKDTRSWLKIVYFLVLILAVAFVISLFKNSLVLNQGARFVMVVSDKSDSVVVVSYDDVEKTALVVSLPEELYIRSRSVGEYQIGRLYQLAEYEESPGSFIRRKVQGFMRIPVSGYAIGGEDVSRYSRGDMSSVLRGVVFGNVDSNLTKFDAMVLLFRGQGYVWNIQGSDELVREGVLVERTQGGYGYNPARLLEYVDGRFFDWNVAQEKYAVSIIDVSGKRGLAQDVSDFVSNMGADVVMVRQGDSDREKSSIVVESEELFDSNTVLSLKNLLGVEEVEVGDTSSYRSQVVFLVGSDMEAIF